MIQEQINQENKIKDFSVMFRVAKSTKKLSSTKIAELSGLNVGTVNKALKGIPVSEKTLLCLCFHLDLELIIINK